MLIKKVVGRPITMLILFSLLIVISIYAFSRLKMDLLPVVEDNNLAIYTVYDGEGVSAQEIEKTVTSVLESNLGLINNVQTIKSISFKGGSSIYVQFYRGTNVDLALNGIRDAIEVSKSLLPEKARLPKVYRSNPTDLEVLSFVLYADRPLIELKRYVDNIIKPKLGRINGVGSIEVNGGETKRVLVEVSPNRLEAYGLTLSKIAPFILSQNFGFSVGKLLDNDLRYQAQVSGEFSSFKDLGDVVISYKNPSTYVLDGSSLAQIRLRDIANIKMVFDDLQTYVHYNGKPSINISIKKQSDANLVIVSDEIKAEIEKTKLTLPKDISLDVFHDASEFIKKSILSVSNAAYSGALLSLCIIFFFLRSLRATIIIGIAIPFAIVFTFFLMYFADISLNVMSLSGLALSVGMLVDCSIVVIDNIYKYRQKGAKLISSAIFGTQEVMLPIMAATLTSICVFLPMLIFKAELDLIGDFIRDFVFTVVVSLAASLFVAVFLVPVLSSYYVGLYTTFQKPIKNKFIRKVDSFFYGIYLFSEKLYLKLLKYVLIHKIIFSLIVLFSFILSLVLLPFLKVSFLPEIHSSSMNFDFSFPNEKNLEISKFYSDKVLEILKSEIKGYKSIRSSVSPKNFFFSFTFSLEEENSRRLIKEERNIKYKVLERVKNLYPDLIFNTSSERTAYGGGASIDIKIIASDFEYAIGYGKLLVSLLKKQFPKQLVNPKLDIKENLQIEIEIDREKAYSYGISLQELSKEIKSNIDGLLLGKYNQDGINYDIVLKLDRGNIVSLSDLDKMFVMNSAGIKIPISSIVRIKKTKGFDDIVRENQSLVVTLTSNISPNENLALITKNVVDFVTNKVPKKDDILVKFEGEYSSFVKYIQHFIILIFMAILLVFGVMAAQFESLLKPFIILFTIPLTLIGVSLIYFISGEHVSVFTAVGMLMLVGIVVNTGIVLVDYINLLIKRGFSLRESVLEAGRSRFRPILMSALTSIIGLSPLAFSDSSENAFVRSIAFTFIGGMIASTLLTLFFIPMIFEIFSNLSVKNFILFKFFVVIGRINSKKCVKSSLNNDQGANDMDIPKNNIKDKAKTKSNFNNLFIDENED
ncbi:efflux RND transporter permease subunit [Borrelia sp. HM]|uniref:efflux RND transporter permease subunit n=1 Tax=Borrelia sp. HM TaxID=1882662 RepID=UPI001C791BF6|nr:efflux RND transporter permease subunit [Borrelia sp. HM]BCR21583.1 efflux RND transporter permease subunit [Borrelia sp. HM]